MNGQFLKTEDAIMATGKKDSMAPIRMVLWAMPALMLWLLPGAAAMADPYTVTRVPISASGKSAAAAKQVAIAKGQRTAFRKLVTRLTRAADRTALAEPGKDDLQAMVISFSLAKEQPGPKNYRARLTVRFNPEEVRGFLSESGVPVAAQAAPPVLVIPILKNGGETLIGQDNPWTEAWEEMDLGNRLTPILLPLGDETDLPVSADSLLAGDAAALDRLKNSYAVSGVLVALAEITGKTGIRASLRGDSPVGQVDFSKQFNGKPSLSAAMRSAAREYATRLEDRWKNASVIDEADGGGEFVALSVPFSGLNEWISIRKTLASIPGVSNMDVRAITARGAHVTLNYGGDIDRLIEALAQRNMRMTNAGDYWELRAE